MGHGPIQLFLSTLEEKIGSGGQSFYVSILFSLPKNKI
jgi:hypothetical protein